MTAQYDPYGKSTGLNYTPAYERAYRLTAIFCRATRCDRKLRPAREFYDWVWDRTAADIEGKRRLVRSTANA